MRIIIFSDTHLTDKFDEKKYRFLKSIIEKADRVIINGDFWDGYRVSIDDFIKSKWRKLFPLLKEKQTIYLYGNHDDVNFSNGEISRFSVKQNKCLTLKNGSKKLIIQHGDAIKPPVYNLFRHAPPNKILASLVNVIFKIGIKLTGEYFFNLFLLARIEQKALKQWAREKIAHNEYLICGHSHLAEFDKEIGYINSGFIDHGYAQYVEIDNWDLRLVKDRY